MNQEIATQVVQAVPGEWLYRQEIRDKLTGLLPGDAPRVWNDVIQLSDVPRGKYTLAVRVPNPLPNGLPLRFANAAQDRDVQGWLSLTEITL